MAPRFAAVDPNRTLPASIRTTGSGRQKTVRSEDYGRCRETMIPPVAFVASKQIDLKLFVELFNKRPPVASKDRRSLDQWIEQMDFQRTEITDEVVLISDRHNIYRQLWVTRRIDNYRSHMIKFLGDEYGRSANFSGFDADHVVARVRLKKYTEAWINIFPVKSTWNRFFGAVEEQEKFQISDSDFLDGLYSLTGFEALKIFYSNIDRIVDVAKKSFATENPTISCILTEMDQLRFL